LRSPTGRCRPYSRRPKASALARVVPPERYAEGVGRNDAREHVASLAASAPFVADATSYAVSFGAIAALRTPLAAPPTERRRLRAEVLDGLRFIWAVPFLRASLLQAAGTSVTWSARR